MGQINIWQRTDFLLLVDCSGAVFSLYFQYSWLSSYWSSFQINVGRMDTVFISTTRGGIRGFGKNCQYVPEGWKAIGFRTYFTHPRL